MAANLVKDFVPSSESLMPSIALGNGTTDKATLPLPVLGYGVGTSWFKCAGTEKELELRKSLEAALDAGFRYIDDAEMYENEEVSGPAINDWLAKQRDAGITRSDLFVCNKVADLDQAGGVRAACERSLARSGLGYFDLYLLHSPLKRDGAPFGTALEESWAAMEALLQEGKVRSIGVSNFRIQDLEMILAAGTLKPSCNQVEGSPMLQQPALMEFCSKHGILVAVYGPQTPLTKGLLQGALEQAVNDAAAAHEATVGQVLLRWALQTGRIPITTTSKPDRMQEYLQTFSFQLTDAEVQSISDAGRQNQKRSFWLNAAHYSGVSDPSGERDSQAVA